MEWIEALFWFFGRSPYKALSVGAAALREIFFIKRPSAAISAFDVQEKRLLIEYLAGPVRIASGRPGKARGLINRNQLAEIDLGCAE